MPVDKDILQTIHRMWDNKHETWGSLASIASIARLYFTIEPCRFVRPSSSLTFVFSVHWLPTSMSTSYIARGLGGLVRCSYLPPCSFNSSSCSSSCSIISIKTRAWEKKFAHSGSNTLSSRPSVNPPGLLIIFGGRKDKGMRGLKGHTKTSDNWRRAEEFSWIASGLLEVGHKSPRRTLFLFFSFVLSSWLGAFFLSSIALSFFPSLVWFEIRKPNIQENGKRQRQKKKKQNSSRRLEIPVLGRGRNIKKDKSNRTR